VVLHTASSMAPPSRPAMNDRWRPARPAVNIW
jgi:hypothetical protein